MDAMSGKWLVILLLGVALATVVIFQLLNSLS